MPIFIFFVSVEVLFDGAFSILKEGVQISLNATLASYALFLVTWIKQNLFLFYFYMEKFDKNSFRAKEKAAISWTLNMKTELHCESCNS